MHPHIQLARHKPERETCQPAARSSLAGLPEQNQITPHHRSHDHRAPHAREALGSRKLRATIFFFTEIYERLRCWRVTPRNSHHKRKRHNGDRLCQALALRAQLVRSIAQHVCPGTNCWSRAAGWRAGPPRCCCRGWRDTRIIGGAPYRTASIAPSPGMTS